MSTLLYHGITEAFFQSGSPARLRNISVRDHAKDGLAVLTIALREGVDGKPLPGLEDCFDNERVASERHADMVIGHSMGVQVALELTLLAPERVNSLVLFNGTSGNALSTGLQWVNRVPYASYLYSQLISYVLRIERSHSSQWFVKALQRLLHLTIIDRTIKLTTQLMGSKEMQKHMGEDYMSQFYRAYIGGVFSNRKSIQSYFRGFQELEAHCATHLLWQIKCPCLLVAGVFDTLTPPYNMLTIYHEVRSVYKRLVIDSFSSHATILEHPERAFGELLHFTRMVDTRIKRSTSTLFNLLDEE